MGYSGHRTSQGDAYERPHNVAGHETARPNVLQLAKGWFCVPTNARIQGAVSGIGGDAMKNPTDLQRLREIEAQQATLIYRLTELKQEEDSILSKYPAVPTSVETLDKRKRLSEQRAIISRDTMTDWWRRRKAATD